MEVERGITGDSKAQAIVKVHIHGEGDCKLSIGGSVVSVLLAILEAAITSKGAQFEQMVLTNTKNDYRMQPVIENDGNSNHVHVEWKQPGEHCSIDIPAKDGFESLGAKVDRETTT